MTTSSEEDDTPSSSKKTIVRYISTNNGPHSREYFDVNRNYIIKVQRDGAASPTERATTHNDMSSSSTSEWEQLAIERGREIKQLEYRIAIMQKVIRQYERKSDKIMRIAEAACSRHNDLDEVGTSYMERGIGHEELASDDEDHKAENKCTYMKRG